MKYSYILILIIAASVFTACEFLGYDEEISDIVKNGEPEDCTALVADDDKSTQTRIEKCYDSYAQKHEQPELCDKIEKESKHDDCYEGLAEKMERLDLCDQLKSDSDDCVSKVGIAKNDESICDGMSKSSAKDRCNQQIAMSKKSLDICEKVDSNSYKDTCLEYLALDKKDVSLCEKMSSYGRDGCIQQLAIALNDESLCEHIENKEYCLEQVVTDEELEESLDDEDLDEELEELDDLEDDTTKHGINEVDGKLYINADPGKTFRFTESDLPSWAQGTLVTVGAMATCVGPPDSIALGDGNVLFDGLPVARKGDSTVHGGTITEGSSKIFINGVAAAFVGAHHVCPLVSPGPVPHVGGPIITQH